MEIKKSSDWIRDNGSFLDRKKAEFFPTGLLRPDISVELFIFI
jgi:hypothetical protein